MTKSPEQKAIEKQMRAQEKAERAAQIRERASGIVAGAHQENGFRILDFESETMLAEILRQYDGNENNTMSFELDNISRSLRDNALVLYEALRMYGMLASVIPYGNSAIMTVTESAKNYFENKDKVTNGGNRMEKQVKIFISHSSDDVKYVRRIVEFLEDLNVPEDGIFCSSIPEYGIPGGEKIFDFLRGQFDTYDLHVIFVLSKNYYNSIASLNEMGAAWVGRNEYTVLLLPHFPYSEITGVLDPREIATKIDDESTINIRLSELRDKILSEFALNKINENKWERVRNSFIADMLEINLEAKVQSQVLIILCRNVRKRLLCKDFSTAYIMLLREYWMQFSYIHLRERIACPESGKSRCLLLEYFAARLLSDNPDTFGRRSYLTRLSHNYHQSGKGSYRQTERLPE